MRLPLKTFLSLRFALSLQDTLIMATAEGDDELPSLIRIMPLIYINSFSSASIYGTSFSLACRSSYRKTVNRDPGVDNGYCVLVISNTYVALVVDPSNSKLSNGFLYKWLRIYY